MPICHKINTRLLPMKIVMFGWFGASACALPFMTVHMKALGLTVKETAVIYTLLPITQTLSSPIAGLIADRLGKYRNVLLVSIFMTVLLTTALLYVPTINGGVTNEELLSINLNLCDQKPEITQECQITSFNNNNTDNKELNSCQLKCDGIIPLNVSVVKVLQTLKDNGSNLCEYITTVIKQHNSTLEDMCSIENRTSLYNCSITCQNTSFSSPGPSGGRYLTFYLYCVLRVVHNIFSAIGYTLVNSSAIALTETNIDMGEYGRQRFWAILAMAIFPPLAGVLVDVFNTAKVINYAPAFHTHNILALLTAIAVWYLDFEMEDAPESYMETFKNFWLIVRNPTIVFLLILVFWLGTVWGFMESFLFLFLHEELRSPTYLLGLTVTIGSIVGLPFLHYARLINSKVGHANILSIAVFVYMIRCIGGSFLTNAWWIMPFETLEIFTYHLMWVAAATYAAHLSPPGLLATIQGFIEGVHFGVGQGSGSLLGGVLTSEFGFRKAFRVMGIISGAVGLIYSVLHYVWLRKETVRSPARRASVKSFPGQKSDRKSSTLSSVEVNGIPQQSVEMTSVREPAKGK